MVNSANPMQRNLSDVQDTAISQLQSDAESVSQWLASWFDAQPEIAPKLAKAMSYSALNGGKRMRASLVLSSARLASEQNMQACGDALAVAGAVEMLHAYSLVHDDLPAMDDAETRRGKPAAHIAFDEATAILAGDALQTAAFEILSDLSCHHNAETRCQLVTHLAKASGLSGMAGGQMLDLQAETDVFSLDATSKMQALKTGALIRASAIMGGLCGGADQDMQDRLARYATDLGLAFQIADDLLDYQASAETLGKPAGRDAETGKASYVGFYGLDGARLKAEALVSNACAELEPYGAAASPLIVLAQFSIDRTH